jgi:exopolysaccharide biosynthesis WecB/TagA/CpsF family protein
MKVKDFTPSITSSLDLWALNRSKIITVNSEIYLSYFVDKVCSSEGFLTTLDSKFIYNYITNKKIRNTFEPLSGSDILISTLEHAQVNDLNVVIYGGSPHDQSLNQLAIKQRYPTLKVSLQSIEVFECGALKDGSIIDRNTLSQAHFIFAALGSPKQENFIRFHEKEFSDNYIFAMGIGGGLDFITGRETRSPLWLRKIGGEWTWRILQNPKRVIRLIRALRILFH